MSNIGNRSQNVEQEQHANTNNSTATEDALTAKSIFENCRKNKTKPHAFSKAVAEVKLTKGKIGWAGALVLRYLSFMMRTQGETVAKKEWVRINLDHISSHYPYLSRSGVDKAIARLIVAGACETKDLNTTFNRPGFDRTRWYHVPKAWRDLAEKDIRYFYAPLASEIGVPAAVIHYNFMHWLGELKKEGKEEVFSLAPSTIMILQPFSKATIKRAIESLVDEELLFPVPGKRCVYAEKPDEQKSSKVDETSSKVDKGGSKVDKVSSKVDNNSYCSSFVVSLEESSKRQAPPASSELSSYDKTNKGYKGTGLEHIEFLSPFETYVATDLPLPETETDTFTNSDTEPALATKFPIIQDFDHLHAQNRHNRGVVEAMTKNTSIERMFREKAAVLTITFFHALGNETADELYVNATDEELFGQLLPRYRQWFHGAGKESELFDIFYYGVFECIIGAFNYARHERKYVHPIPCFISVAYDAYCVMLKRAEKRRLASIEEETAELQETFAGPDEHKEWECDLSPAEKARVFKQGLYSRNKVGWICLGGERKTDQIVITSPSLRDVEKLFELNPDACAGHMLRIMDGCMKLHASYPPVPKSCRKGIKWHARMGHKLSMFTKHLGTITRQVGIGSAFTRFIGDERDDVENTTDAEPELQEAG